MIGGISIWKGQTARVLDILAPSSYANAAEDKFSKNKSDILHFLSFCIIAFYNPVLLFIMSTKSLLIAKRNCGSYSNESRGAYNNFSKALTLKAIICLFIYLFFCWDIIANMIQKKGNLSSWKGIYVLVFTFRLKHEDLTAFLKSQKSCPMS